MEHPMLLDSRQSFEHRTMKVLDRDSTDVSHWIYHNINTIYHNRHNPHNPQISSASQRRWWTLQLSNSSGRCAGTDREDPGARWTLLALAHSKLQICRRCSAQFGKLHKSEDSGHFKSFQVILCHIDRHAQITCSYISMPYGHLWSYYGRIESDFVKNFCLARGSLSLGRCSFLDMYIMGVSHHRFTA
jgi:hypothetical protein